MHTLSIGKLGIYFLFLIIIMGTSCQTYKEYYYSSFDTDLPRVYEYACKADSTKSQYWRIVSARNNLTTEAFDANYVQFELIQEEFNHEGSVLVSYINFDEVGAPLYRDIQKTDVYKWKKDGPYEYAIELDDNGERIFFLKERTFVGRSNVSVLGTDYNCLKFKGVYKFGLVGEPAEYEYYQYSYYAKGIGMVKYERYFPDGESIILELTKIYNEQEWERKMN
ncbi:hypothetical protein [Lewinella sp. LCG006]|uniref:TapB family protein n=1 Tax=Lewinella sp. LCG006 TaxID=3231911 RepID=UPI003461759C